MKINAQLKKIIYELSKDARQPASHIAKKARVSKDVAFYNIKNLMNKAIITKLITLINTESLGYQRYELFIQLSDFSVEKELIQNLTNHQMFLWVRRSLGEWDVLSEFYSKNNVQAEKILNNLKTEYGQQIKKTSLSIVMKEHSFPLRLLGYNEKETIFCDEQKKEAQIDKEDRIILKYLSNNARIPVTEIAPNSSLSTDAIIYRIKKLIKNKIILGYRAVIDEKKLGLNKFKIIIKLKIIDNQSYNKLFTYFSLQKNTQYLKTCFGEWDLSVTVLTKDSFELKNIISEIRTELKEILDDIKVLMLFEEYKNDYFPKGILDTEK